MILQSKIMTICRDIYGDELKYLAQALYLGGIRVIEVTFDHSNPNSESLTCQSIEMLCENFDMQVGAGTVLTPRQVDVAHSAGATFIVSPNTDKYVIQQTKILDMISIPGAMTASEAVMAHQNGADIVKIFPAGFLGTEFIKFIKAPLSHMNFLASAGITPKNAKEFLDSGYIGLGVSGYLANKELATKKDFESITKRAQEFLSAID